MRRFTHREAHSNPKRMKMCSKKNDQMYANLVTYIWILLCARARSARCTLWCEFNSLIASFRPTIEAYNYFYLLHCVAFWTSARVRQRPASHKLHFHYYYLSLNLAYNSLLFYNRFAYSDSRFCSWVFFNRLRRRVESETVNKIGNNWRWCILCRAIGIDSTQNEWQRVTHTANKLQ